MKGPFYLKAHAKARKTVAKGLETYSEISYDSSNTNDSTQDGRSKRELVRLLGDAEKKLYILKEEDTHRATVYAKE